MKILSKLDREGVDLDLLKTRFIEYQFPFKRVKGELLKGCIHERDYDMIEQLCNMYGCKLIVKMFDKGKDPGFEGMYKQKTNKLYVLLEKGSKYTLKKLLRVVCHELSHRIQYMVLFEKYGRGREEYKEPRELIRYEKAAELLSYYLYKNHFKNFYPEMLLTKEDFSVNTETMIKFAERAVQ